MSEKRQKTQLELAFATEGKGEAPSPVVEGAETFAAACEPGSPESTERLMEEVCERENLKKALKRVRSNRGSPGVDGMTVDDLPGYLREHWPTLRDQLLSGAYVPQAVKRVEIPKPGGGVRRLGVPSALDRFIQQAVLQVLQPSWDPTFSEHSYGFRPGRSAHQAVAQAQTYIADGHGFVVDLDLEKFFDRVNHDMLMGRVGKRVKDKRLLKLMGPTEEGVPQGGPLSPLLSNLMLDDLDRELERRGHRFVRYGDDCNVYVRTERAGQRVMESLRHFITNKLKLQVNEAKSAVARPQERKFLGFRFTSGRRLKRCIAPQALRQFKKRVRELTRRNRGVSLQHMIWRLARYLRGWRAEVGVPTSASVRPLRCSAIWTRGSDGGSAASSGSSGRRSAGDGMG
jgi:RNA-directed DNA polymerase